MTSFAGGCTALRTSAAFGAAILIMVVVGACGGSANDPGNGAAVGAPFAARALSACASAQKSKSGWSAFPASNFNPEKPDSRQLPQVGDWLEGEVQPTFDAWFKDLKALGEPPTGHEAWTQVLALVEKIDNLNRTQIQTARGGNTSAFADATRGLHDVQPKLERATRAAGVGKCADVHAG